MDWQILGVAAGIVSAVVAFIALMLRLGSIGAKLYAAISVVQTKVDELSEGKASTCVEHSSALDEHGRLLDEHGRQLRRHESQLAQLPRFVPDRS